MGQAFNFNGVDQYVQVPDSPAWEFGNSDFSIELWAKFNVASGDQVFVAHAPGPGNLRKWIFWLNSGMLRMHVNEPGVTNVNIGSGAFIPVTNQWYHLAVTRSGPLFSFYVNAALNFTTNSSVEFPATEAPLTVGQAENMAFLNGAEDEISIYNRALSLSEIQAIYVADAGGKCVASPIITTQPTNLTLLAGASAVFNVGVSTTAPVGYQRNWNGTNIPFATNSPLILTNVQVVNEGSYSVLVTNLGGFANSSNASLTVLPGGSCEPPPPGLLGWWAGEGDARDSFGANHGTLQGGAGFVTGEVVQAFGFNGSGAYVQVPDSPAWDFGTNDFSIELWAARFNLPAANQVLVAHDQVGTTSPKWVFRVINGFLQMHLRSPAIGEVFLNSSQFNPATNQWYHLAVTRNGPFFSFYVNGSLDSTVSNTVSVPDASALLTFGRSANFMTPGGQMDEVCIYNRSLSGAEILAIYNADTAGKCSVPVSPIIYTQSPSRTVFSGTDVTVEVAAVGTLPLSYQWKLNGTNINMATNSSLVLTNVHTNQAGSYSVVVTNIAGSTNSSNTSLTVLPLGSCVPKPQGLVGWWSAEGTAGNSLGTNHGVLQNGAGFVPGQVGQAFNFNGINQYVQVPDSPAWYFDTHDFSIELWARFNSPGGNQVLVANDQGPGSVPKWLFWLNNGQLRMHLNWAGGATDLGSGAFVPVSNQWYHLAVTRSGSVFSFYVNGALNSTANSTVQILNANAPLTLGQAENTAFLNGSEDEVSIYDRGLSESEIQLIYNAGSVGKCLIPLPPVIASQSANQTVSGGINVTFEVSVSGTPPLSYQWKLNGTNIALATNSSFTLTNVQAANVGNYSVLITNVAGFTNSSNSTLTLLLPAGCVPPPSGLIAWWLAEGSAVDSSGTNSGELKNGAGFAAGEVGQAFNFNGTNQYVEVSSSPAFNFSGSFTMEAWVYWLPGPNAVVMGKWSDSGDYQSMRSYVLAVTAGGALQFGISDAAHQGNDSFHIFNTTNNAIPTSTWTHVAAVYDQGTGTRRMYVNGVNVTNRTDAPITVLNANTKFSIGARMNSSTVAVDFFAGRIDEASLYNRALSGTEIMANYNAGGAGKCAALAITSQPLSQTVPAGTNVTFTVTAWPPPLSYQWKWNGTNIALATNNSLTLTNVQAANGGNYSVLVMNNMGGSTNSSNALLTVNPAGPMITLQPQDLLVPAGTNATFAVAVKGSEPFGYHWKFNSNDIPGALGPMLTITNAQMSNAGNYSVFVTNVVGSTNSSNAILTVGQLNCVSSPSGLISWWSGEGNAQDSGWTNHGTLTAGAFTGGNVGQAFSFNGSANDIVQVSNSTSLHFTGQTPVTVELWAYRTGAQPSGTLLGKRLANCGNFEYQMGFDSVNGLYFNGGNPGTQSGGVASGVQLPLNTWVHLAATFDGSIFRFYTNGVQVGTGIGALGANNAAPFTIGGAGDCPGFEGLLDEVSLYNRALPASEIQSIYLAGGFGKCPTAPTILNHPQTQTVSAGNNATIGVTATGSAPLIYLWTLNGTNLPFTNRVFTQTNVQSVNAGNYSVLVTNAVGSTNSISGTLTVSPTAPIILTHPASQSLQLNGTANFNVTVKGTDPMGFQWQFNGTNLSGQTNSTLSVSGVQSSNAGNYRVAISNTAGATNSSNATLTVLRSRVIAWGNNAVGQTNVPASLTNAMAIGSGQHHGIAVRSNTTVVAWGFNSGGQTNVPAGLSNIVAVSGGASHVLALRNNGAVAAWGGNSVGQTNIPAGLTNIAAIAAGYNHNVVLGSNGTVAAWGDNSQGQTNLPAGLSNVAAIASGAHHSVVLKTDGSIVGWGNNSDGQATSPSGLSNIVGIAAGGMHTLALRNDGTVVAWGQNGFGQTNVPAGLSNVATIAGGFQHSMALQTDGTVIAWGRNTEGQTNIPTGILNAVAINGGGLHSLAFENDGSPIVIRQPWNQTIPAGADISFSLMAMGRPALGYQWRFNGTNIDGATNALLSLTNVPVTAEGAYSVLVANSIASVTSSNGMLTVVRSLPQFDTSVAGLQFTTNGLSLTLTGLSGHGPVVIYCSTNLVDWQPIFTNPPLVGTLIFLDSAATNLPVRFYRAEEQ